MMIEKNVHKIGGDRIAVYFRDGHKEEYIVDNRQYEICVSDLFPPTISFIARLNKPGATAKVILNLTGIAGYYFETKAVSG